LNHSLNQYHIAAARRVTFKTLRAGVSANPAAPKAPPTPLRPKMVIYQGFSTATAPAGWPTVSQDSDSSDENGEVSHR
jgi:hypothetical protein